MSLLLGRLLVGVIRSLQNHIQSSTLLLHQRFSDDSLGIDYSFLSFLSSPLFLFFFGFLASQFQCLIASFLLFLSLLFRCFLLCKSFLAFFMSSFDFLHLFFDGSFLCLLLLFTFLLPLKFLLLLLLSGDTKSLLLFFLFSESSGFGLFLSYFFGSNLFLGCFHLFQ